MLSEQGTAQVIRQFKKMKQYMIILGVFLIVLGLIALLSSTKEATKHALTAPKEESTNGGSESYCAAGGEATIKAEGGGGYTPTYEEQEFRSGRKAYAIPPTITP